MKSFRSKVAQSIAVSVLTAGMTAPVYAEVSASAGVASTYLWRGYDLGSGTPAVSGDLNYSAAGFYTGIWGSSGDTGSGTEYDLYAGYGMAFGQDGMFTVDLSIWNYNYPTGSVDEGEDETDFGDLSEVVLSLGAGPIAFTYYDNVAGGSGYAYYTLAGTFGDFTLLGGMHDETDGTSPTHLDLTYAYNDNLAFTFSQFVDDEPEGDDLKFVVSYSLPIEF